MYHSTYNPQGEEISTKALTDITTPDDIPFLLEQVAFTNDGNFVIVINGGFNEGNHVYVYNNEGLLLGKLFINFNESIATLHDGRAVALKRSDTESSLREIDFTTGDWGASTSFPVPNVKHILSAGSSQQFDLLADDGSYLYGFSFESHTLTPILNWIESNIKLPHDRYYLAFLDEDRFSLFYTEFIFIGDNYEVFDDLFVLSRTSREEMPERTIITLGGLWFSDELRMEIIAFNRENQYYQIQLKDYNIYGDWDAAELRFNTEMITGRGPDIIFSSNQHLEDGGFMVDLYTFIDADPELTRSDFFPNVLQLQEASDGTLRFITNSFMIRTMIALRDVAEQIEPLTFDSLLKRIDESDEPTLISSWLADKTIFLSHSLHLSGGSFIDLDNNKAYLDSEAFIQLLELCNTLPIRPESGFVDTTLEDDSFRRGELLLKAEFISDPNQLREYQAHYGDIIAVGMPTTTGGQHVISENAGIGINTTSEHKEAAWGFIRRLLLPEAVVQYSFPLRIDMFEEQIIELMTPIIVDGVEQPRLSGYSSHGFYVMTEEEASEIREIITSASIRRQFNDTIWTIIQEDVQPFFAGARSAEETARVIQNRVQRYLDERS